MFIVHSPNGAVVEVLGSAAPEEDPLQDAGGELDGVLQRGVEGVHDGGVAVAHPVRLIHLLPEFGEGVVGPEQSCPQSVPKVIVV